jgi:integral membrane protein
MKPLLQLRIMSLLEGVSLLVLVFVAMPLKYFAGEPAAVRLVGSIHGLLFLGFCLALFRVTLDRRWPLSKSSKAMLASIVPFGALFLERSLRHEELRER